MAWIYHKIIVVSHLHNIIVLLCTLSSSVRSVIWRETALTSLRTRHHMCSEFASNISELALNTSELALNISDLALDISDFNVVSGHQS